MITSSVSATNLSASLPVQKEGNDIEKSSRGFSDILKSTIQQVNQADTQGDTAINKLFTGEAQNLHEIMISAEEADIAIRMLVQMRNKALEAYNEIMRMQI